MKNLRPLCFIHFNFYFEICASAEEVSGGVWATSESSQVFLFLGFLLFPKRGERNVTRPALRPSLAVTLSLRHHYEVESPAAQQLDSL